MSRTAAERRADKEARLAELVYELVDGAGVVESPSAVRHALAATFANACSQSTVNRLVDALEQRRRRRTA